MELDFWRAFSVSLPLACAIPIYLWAIFRRRDTNKPGSYLQSPFKSTRLNNVLKKSLASLMLSISLFLLFVIWFPDQADKLPFPLNIVATVMLWSHFIIFGCLAIVLLFLPVMIPHMLYAFGTAAGQGGVSPVRAFNYLIATGFKKRDEKDKTGSDTKRDHRLMIHILVAAYVLFFLSLIFIRSDKEPRRIVFQTVPPHKVTSRPPIAVSLPTGFNLWKSNPGYAVWDNNTPDNPSDDVVLDTATDLMWARDAGLLEPTNWRNASAFCDSLVLGNWTDWRLPTIAELTSLSEPPPVDHCPTFYKGHPFVNVRYEASFFDPREVHFFWSSDASLVYGYCRKRKDGEYFSSHELAHESRYARTRVWPVRGGD